MRKWGNTWRAESKFVIMPEMCISGIQSVGRITSLTQILPSWWPQSQVSIFIGLNGIYYLDVGDIIFPCNSKDVPKGPFYTPPCPENIMLSFIKPTCYFGIPYEIWEVDVS